MWKQVKARSGAASDGEFDSNGAKSSTSGSVARAEAWAVCVIYSGTPHPTSPSPLTTGIDGSIETGRTLSSLASYLLPAR